MELIFKNVDRKDPERIIMQVSETAMCGFIKSYRISQGYPCTAENLITDGTGKECKSSGELDECIEQMLKTDDVRKSISVFLSQTA